jgi:diketogulonate reductase-like aldo/keto reductase
MTTNSYQTIGIGTYKLQDNICTNIIKEGLNYGYKLIDTAQLYKNHKQVADGIKMSNISRSDIFITSKIHNKYIKSIKIAESIDKILKELDTQYLDLLLLHNPVKNYDLAYVELIRCQTHFDIKHIGVSNFNIEHLECINNLTQIKPYLNQIELNVLNKQINLVNYHNAHNIITQSHTNIKTHLNSNKMISVPSSVYNEYKFKTSTEYLLSYPIKENIGIIPGTSSIENLKHNYDFYQWCKQNPMQFDDINYDDFNNID